MADGQVTIKATLDASGVKAGVREINSDIDGIKTNGMDNLSTSTKGAGSSAGSAGKGYTQMANTLANTGTAMTAAGNTMKNYITDPLVDMGKTAVETAGEFNQTMNMVQAMSGATQPEMEALRQKAIQVGADTKFSANESAYALLELSKAGMSNDQILNGVLDSTMKLATVGELQLADAATVTTNAMNTFGLEADSTEQIVVALAGAANASTADVSSLAEGLGNCGAVASQVGWSINDVCGVLGVFEDNGIHGAEAGTQLKSVLLQLMKAGEQHQDVLDELGISFYDESGKMKSCSEIAGLLRASMSGLSDEQRNAYMNTLFGSYAIQGANILYQSGADAIDGYTDATYDAEAAQRMMEAAMSDIPGAMERMSGSIETMLMATGDALAPAVIAVADFVGSLADVFTSLPEGAQVAIAVILAIVAAIGPLLAIGGLILSVISGVMLMAAAAGTTMIGVIGGALSAAAPVIAVIAGVIAAIAAIVMIVQHLWETNEGFRSAVEELVANVTSIIQQLADIVGPIIEAIGGFVVWLWETISPVLDAILGFLGTTVVNVLNVLLGFIADTVLPTIQGAIDYLKPIIEAFADFFKTYVQPVIEAVMAGVVAAWDNASKGVGQILDGLKQVIEGVWKVITGIVETVVGLIVGIVTGDFSMMENGVNNIMGGIDKIINGVLDTISGIFGTVIGGIVSFVKGAFESIFEHISGPMNDAKNLVSSAIEFIEGVFGGANFELPHISLPHISIQGGFSLTPPSAPSFAIDWYAAGGYFNGPSVIGIGEGPYDEVAMPLSPKVLGGIADGITKHMGGGSNGDVTVMVKIERFVNEREEDIDMLIERIERKVKRDMENAL